MLATLWVAGRLRSLLFMLFIALFFSVALEPAVQFLVRRGWKRGVATGVAFLVAFLVIIGFLAALVPLFISQAVALADGAPGYLEQAQTWLDGLGFVDVGLIDQQIADQFANLEELLRQYGSRVASGILAVGNTIFSAIFQLFTITLFAYYMVAEGPKMRRTLLSFLPPTRQREVLRIWEIAVAKTGGYIYSRLILAAVSAVFTSAVLGLLGLPYAIALGLWVGVLSQFVPVIGAYIAAVLPALVALFDSPIKALWVVVALIGYQQLENFWVAPKITARTMAIHPAVSIGAVIAGANLLGGIGAVLALPVTATIQAFVSTALNRHDLVSSEALIDPSDIEHKGDEPVDEETVENVDSTLS